MKIENLYPEKVFHYFSEISKIPRGSNKEKKISDWIVEFAKERNLKYYTDSKFNIVIWKDASIGYEDKEILKIENDKKIIELAYTAIKDIKIGKKGNKISKCYKLVIKTNSKDLKFFVRPKRNYFGGADDNDFDNLENFYFFLREKISK